jgi:hypothetical protein
MLEAEYFVRIGQETMLVLWRGAPAFSSLADGNAQGSPVKMFLATVLNRNLAILLSIR